MVGYYEPEPFISPLSHFAPKTKVESKYKNPIFEDKITYADHVFEASSFSIPKILNYPQMDSLIYAEKLVNVPEESESYYIQKLTHSRPALLPQAYDVLLEITDLFYEKTGKKLSISSLVRTEETQKKLRRVNRNAAKGTSAHVFGAAFDISYSQYNHVRGRNWNYENILQQILDDLVAEGKIFYIKERRQPCFHITVRNPDLIYPEDYFKHEHDAHLHDDGEELDV
jgi:hypothetical protein